MKTSKNLKTKITKSPQTNNTAQFDIILYCQVVPKLWETLELDFFNKKTINTTPQSRSQKPHVKA